MRKINHCYCSTAYDIKIKTRENNSHSRSYSHLPRESMRGIENKWEVRLFLRPPNFMVPVLRLQGILAYYFNTLADLKKYWFCCWADVCGCQSPLSTFTVWVLGTELRWSGLVASTFTQWAILLALSRTKWTLGTCRTEKKKKDQYQKVLYSWQKYYVSQFQLASNSQSTLSTSWVLGLLVCATIPSPSEEKL